MSANLNKQTMIAIFEKIAVGDGSLFIEHLADDVRMIITGQYSWSQTLQGKEAVLGLYAYVRSVTQGGLHTHAYNFIADGDTVVVEAKGAMTAIGGEAYHNDYCLIYKLKNNKIIEIKEYQDSNLCERVLGPFPSKPSA